MKLISRIAALGAALAGIGQEPVMAQPLAERLRAICPAGHRIEFRFRDASLFVDLSLLSVDTLRRVHEAAGGSCPSAPLRGIRVLIGYQDNREVARQVEERGLPPHLLISERRDAIPMPSDVPSVPETRRYVPGGYVEDITSKVPGRSFAAGRWYQLQHDRLPDGSLPRPIIISCAGEPGNPPGRGCTVIYSYGPDLMVDYRFRLDRSDGPRGAWPTADGKISEPDDLVAFDRRVRAFIEELRLR